MRKYPFVRQSGNKDCGAACLSMVIQYYHGYVPIEKLKEETQTNRNGVSAYHLIECASKLGFHAKGMKGTIEHLKQEEVQVPFIAHVILEGSLGHYLVIYKINKKKKQLLIADPSDKIKKLSFEEFEKIWSGNIITLYPYKKLPLYNKEFSFKSFFFTLMKDYKSEFIQLFFLSVFLSCFSILQSFHFEFFSNKLQLTTKEEPYFFLFYLFLTMVFLKQVTNYFRHSLLIRMNVKIDYFLHQDTFETLIYLPYRYYRTRTTGEITSKINDLEYVKSFLGEFVTTILVDGFLGIACFIVLLFLSFKLAIISLLIGISLLFLSSIFYNSIKTNMKQSQLERANVTSYMVESIHGFQSIKNLNLEKKTIQNYLIKYQNYIKQYFKLYQVTLKQTILKELFTDAFSLIILFLGFLEIINGKITLGKLVSIQMLVSYFMVPFHSFFSIFLNYHEVKTTLEHLSQLFYQEKNIPQLSCNMNFPIEIQNLTYSFEEKPIFKNLSLTIKEGEKIMLVGQSGSGKSTLAKLFLKYYPVERTYLSFNQIDINDISPAYVEQFISYISQEEILFTGTLWDNLTMGNKVKEEEVLEIARICEVSEIANQSNLGYFRLIEENGFQLSGGEKERIILARTLILRHPFFIIDEGMGQMDVSQERRILKNILAFDPSLTILFISHRIDNQDLFHRVIEFEDGKKKRDMIKNDGNKAIR